MAANESAGLGPQQSIYQRIKSRNRRPPGRGVRPLLGRRTKFIASRSMGRA
jgi:hypothetical protein